MSAFISSYDNEIKELKLVNATSLSVAELVNKLVLFLPSLTVTSSSD